MTDRNEPLDDENGVDALYDRLARLSRQDNHLHGTHLRAEHRFTCQHCQAEYVELGGEVDIPLQEWRRL